LSFGARGFAGRIREGLYPSTEPTCIDPGTAAVLAGAFLSSLPVVAGALRAMLGICLPAGFMVAAVVWVVLVTVLLHRFRPTKLDPGRAVCVAFAVALPTVLAFRGLDNAFFDGLPSTGGGDAGNHVMLQQRFLNDQPREYAGFVAFYAATWVPEALLHTDVFAAFRAAFYMVPIVLILSGVLAVALAHSDVKGPSGNSIAIVLAGPFLSVALWVALLPLLHRYQGDGFYPQVFGIVTLCLAWLLWGLVDDPWLRAIFLVASVGLYRWSYGLNLGDFAFGAAMLLLLDWPKLAKTRLGVLATGLCALLLIGGGVAALTALYPHRATPGGIIPARTDLLLRGLGLTVLGLLATSRAPAFTWRFGPRFRRFLDFASVFALSSLAIEVVYLATGNPFSYYFFKHGFHPAALAILAVTVLALVALSDIITAARRSAWRAAVLILVPLLACTLAFGFLASAMETYRDSFRERVSGSPPWKTLLTLWDQDATARIQQVLAERKKVFGGYLTPLWAEANFTNAAFGHWRGFDIYGASALTEDPGYCVFWQATKDDIRSLENAELGGKGALLPVVTALERGDKQCSDYAPRWDPGQRRHLCHRCF
jgi:hypothetical protein